MHERITVTKPLVSLEWTGERYTTGANEQVEIEHYHRYLLARSLCHDKDVLDAACGEGYGSALIAQIARSVIGVDLASDAVKFASQNYKAANLQYTRMDVQTLTFDAGRFDAIVSFETIEHIHAQRDFIKRCKDCLRPGGFVLVSSPDTDFYRSEGDDDNPYHVRELTEAAFSDLLRSEFAHVRFLYQAPVVGSSISGGTDKASFFERVGDDEIEVSAVLRRAPYIVALASDGPLPQMGPSLYVHRRDVEMGSSKAFDPTETRHAIEVMRGNIYGLAEEAVIRITDRNCASKLDKVHENLRSIMRIVSTFEM